MNIPRFKKIIDQIKSHPETWNQEKWHSECGTKHCIAGWAQIHAGKSGIICDTWIIGKHWLELTRVEAHYLFGSYRTMEDFERILEHGFQSMSPNNKDLK